MKKVRICDTAAEAHLLQGLLEQAGIPSEVQNENLVMAFGEIPPVMDTMPAVAVLKDEDAERAAWIVRRFLSGGKAEPAPATQLAEPAQAGDAALQGLFVVSVLAAAAVVLLLVLAHAAGLF